MKYFYTLVTFVFAIFFYLVTYYIDLKLFVKISGFLQTLEALEISKFILPVLMILGGFVYDILKISYRKKVHLEKQREKIRVFKMTMRTVQDIFINFLNHLLLFVLEAQESQALNEATIEELNDLIQEATKKINELANFKKIIEQENNNTFRMIDMDKSH